MEDTETAAIEAAMLLIVRTMRDSDPLTGAAYLAGLRGLADWARIENRPVEEAAYRRMLASAEAAGVQ